ncbi:amino acid ABC transporter ATP-binding protein [Leuconostoc pseudomesenteroides]|uniref:amino acid ABC transporter ATP-binding protein n=1 Tax=Leuconostoc pseudomesenteroides TaxID=33968 RepID=UPI001B8B086A|nr:amino acid ABC transporter ATP-binding protein [Leuconostoc pseudomesenteroides]MBS0958961.1 amino acid ABC transporter ATP-binding protein [Leuconostoc pseudomesenteroides]
MITISNVSKSFSGKQILKNVSTVIEQGEVLVIIGPSGSGKTTFLRSVSLLERADSGNINIDGAILDFQNAKNKEILNIRRQMGFVFQNFNLFNNKTALQNVEIGLTVGRKFNKEVAERVALKTLDSVGLKDRANHYPIQLSGGEQQRVAIARAAVLNPKIIFFDEPTSALDVERVDEVLNVIKSLAKDGKTMVIVTHELSFAREVASKIAFMENGRILEQGSVKDIFEHPKEKRTEEFIRKIQNS